MTREIVYLLQVFENSNKIYDAHALCNFYLGNLPLNKVMRSRQNFIIQRPGIWTASGSVRPP